MGLLFSKMSYGILHSVKHTSSYTKKNLGSFLGMMQSSLGGWFFFNFVRQVGWSSFTTRLRQIWLQVGDGGRNLFGFPSCCGNKIDRKVQIRQLHNFLSPILAKFSKKFLKALHSPYFFCQQYSPQKQTLVHKILILKHKICMHLFLMPF